jgi:pimeloyl-ACP methyl ester carboxylesterase
MTDFRTFRTSDGLRLHYAVDDFTDPWRRADTLLLLHAAMGSVDRFRGWVPTLARDFRVVRLDTRGHGRSETPGADRPVTIERLTRDVLELLDDLGCANAHVCGTSAGGYAAMSLAITAPDAMASGTARLSVNAPWLMSRISDECVW